MDKSKYNEKHMHHALSIALKAGNKTKSNPFVGCVVTNSNDEVIGSGYHEMFGSGHAEVNALAGVDINKVENVYVTLEPCFVESKTPACVNLFLDKGITNIYIGAIDPNVATSGKSISKLIENKINVEYNLINEEVKTLNLPFYTTQNEKRPYIVLKNAITLDGKIATKDFDSKWISNEKCRGEVQTIRKYCNAILVGKNTILQDNPLLTVREDNSFSPLRIIIDRKNELDKSLNVFNDDNYVVFSEVASSEKNVEVVDFSRGWGYVYENVFEILMSKYNVSSILVEGGASVANYFVANNMYDEWILYVAPKLTASSDSVSLLDFKSITSMNESIDLTSSDISIVGDNIKIVHGKKWTTSIFNTLSEQK